MASLVSSFGSGMAFLMPFFLTCCIITTMIHPRHAEKAHEIRQELSARIAEEIAPAPEVAQAVAAAAASVPMQAHAFGEDAPLSRAENLDTPTLDAVRGALHEALPGDEGAANKLFQGYRTSYHQQMLPVAVRHIFPKWLAALLLMLCILLVVSTDDTRIFDIAMTWTQDFILPFFKRAPSPRLHLAIFKAVVLAVGGFFFLGSCLFSQLDYINMFITIGCSMWFTGAGAVVTLGLYWRRGTTAGAYASLISAATISLCGILVQRGWADTVLPWLAAHGLDGTLRHALAAASAPFDPWIRWAVTDAEWAVKFPVNSIELSFIALLSAMLLYVLVSLLTCRKPFNLQKMLHRGEWADKPASGAAAPLPLAAGRTPGDGKLASPGQQASVQRRPAFHTRLLRHLVGITPEYTREDRAIAWAVFGYQIVYGFFGTFALVAICAKVFHWNAYAWTVKMFVTNLIVPLAMGIATTIWFTWGTMRDIRRLFRDLESRVRDDSDNGMVETR